eukprot:Cvel_28089.t1-p1 / transcript=Cvel_28089.t1 / gene=Cvel_28089 / organism=Chromera_velia_CCMP2878 / gene_product=Kinesin-like protein KIF2C, putative / transcript_product=Kinesin-like protein KIF2C, putative / location=Cvel_scaffold3613:11013-15411(+) / protein_length=762 / sequence_SO=supercontig / SO=protein_coding / is_pseudo=false
MSEEGERLIFIPADFPKRQKEPIRKSSKGEDLDVDNARAEFRTLKKPPSLTSAKERAPKPNHVPPAETDSVPSRPAPKKGGVVEEIEKLRVQREMRRKAMDDARKNREQQEQMKKEMGIIGDIDFQCMIDEYRGVTRIGHAYNQWDPHTRILVCVRKRPIFSWELAKKEIDAVTVQNPFCVVHDCKYRVDGITKYLENSSFTFDYAFSETATNAELFACTCSPLLDHVLLRGERATLFAYGQTGSGKTYTMSGMQSLLCEELNRRFFSQRDHGKKPQSPGGGKGTGLGLESLCVGLSFYEIYGNRVFDLLNGKKKVEVLEDHKNEVQIQNLTETEADSGADLLRILEEGNALRTTHATDANEDSSRSHAICTLRFFHKKGGASSPPLHTPHPTYSKLTLVDLAGSERAHDATSNNKQRKVEGAEINKSLLALKECIRALDNQSHSHGHPKERGPGGGGHGGSGDAHVPFRASKLTLVLRDSFTHKKARTLMIACVSPGATSSDHTLNTLRYADRLKERPSQSPHGNSHTPSPQSGQVLPQQGTAWRPAQQPQPPAGSPRNSEGHLMETRAGPLRAAIASYDQDRQAAAAAASASVSTRATSTAAPGGKHALPSRLPPVPGGSEGAGGEPSSPLYGSHEGMHPVASAGVGVAEAAGSVASRTRAKQAAARGGGRDSSPSPGGPGAAARVGAHSSAPRAVPGRRDVSQPSQQQQQACSQSQSSSAYTQSSDRREKVTHKEGGVMRKGTGGSSGSVMREGGGVGR